MISQEVLKFWLRYDPETGVFTWRRARPRIHIGMTAGHRTCAGYIRITVCRRRYMAHILAWLYMRGEYIPRQIDHRDLDGTNNIWRNLRRASASQNGMNRGLRSDNKTGVKGARLKKGKGARPYYATISVGGKQKHLGYFDTVEEAAAAYALAAHKHFGEFARAA